MGSSDIIEKSDLHDWVEDQTRALDVVASWETLCDVYKTLEFTDPINDTMKMEEFKWIIGEMNKHLTRARKKLLSCTDPDAMVKVLEKMFTTSEANVTNRMNLTYHKLRQIWVNGMIMKLNTMMELMTESEGGEDAYRI